jgi:hypothetical protein
LGAARRSGLSLLAGAQIHGGGWQIRPLLLDPAFSARGGGFASGFGNNDDNDLSGFTIGLRGSGAGSARRSCLRERLRGSSAAPTVDPITTTTATLRSSEQRQRRPVDGLGGPMDGLAGLIHGFSFFCFFILFTEAGIQPSWKRSHLP